MCAEHPVLNIVQALCWPVLAPPLQEPAVRIVPRASALKSSADSPKPEEKDDEKVKGKNKAGFSKSLERATGKIDKNKSAQKATDSTGDGVFFPEAQFDNARQAKGQEICDLSYADWFQKQKVAFTSNFLTYLADKHSSLRTTFS